MEYKFATPNGYIYHVKVPNKEVAITCVQKHAGSKIATTKEEMDLTRKANAEAHFLLDEWDYVIRRCVSAGWTEDGTTGERKIWKLVTNVGNVYPTMARYGWTASEDHEKIADLREEGYTIAKIAEILKLTRGWVITNTPYTKGSYVIGEKSENALKIQKCRGNKKEK